MQIPSKKSITEKFALILAEWTSGGTTKLSMIRILPHTTHPLFVNFSIFEGKNSHGNGWSARIKRENNKVLKIGQISSKS
jgi:hypothetical protein